MLVEYLEALGFIALIWVLLFIWERLGRKKKLKL